MNSATGCPVHRLGDETGWTTLYYFSSHDVVRREEWRHQWKRRQESEDQKWERHRYCKFWVQNSGDVFLGSKVFVESLLKSAFDVPNFSNWTSFRQRTSSAARFLRASFFVSFKRFHWGSHFCRPFFASPPTFFREERNGIESDRLRRREETEEYKMDLADRSKQRRMREIEKRDYGRSVYVPDFRSSCQLNHRPILTAPPYQQFPNCCLIVDL